MKVLSDTTRDVIRHYRTIEIEDGPVVDAGEGPMASYYPGTLFRADRIKQEWVGKVEPETVLVSGPYIGDRTDARDRYEVRYRAKDGYPEWIKNIL
jgi:hypothetical protein